MKMASILETGPTYFFIRDVAAETQQEGYKQEQQEKKDGMSTGLKVTFDVILGLVIAAVAAGILSKTERDRLVDILKNGEEDSQRDI